MPGAFKPPPPQAPVPVRYVCVRTRPQRGLAGVFALPRAALDALKRKRDPQGDGNIHRVARFLFGPPHRDASAGFSCHREVFLHERQCLYGEALEGRILS